MSDLSQIVLTISMVNCYASNCEKSQMDAIFYADKSQLRQTENSDKSVLKTHQLIVNYAIRLKELPLIVYYWN